MFPKKGNIFRGGSDRENGSTNYASLIATALRTELGSSHRATKTVMRWTGASERTVKHWLAGHHGPGGEYLIVLMRKSEAVYEAVLAAAGRRDALVAARVLATQATMVELMAMAEREGAGPAYAGLLGVDQPGGWTAMGPDDPKNDRTNDRIDDPANPAPGEGLNPRQRWFLEALASGKAVRAGDLQRHWGVSEKTARRDVAGLKNRGMIEFVGPFRTGRYRLSR